MPHNTGMTKQPKRPRDPAQLAKLIVDIATGEKASVQPDIDSSRDAMAQLGRVGGLKGGRARAEKLTAKQRSTIARKAATARWRKDDN